MTKLGEIWEEIPGYNGRYFVSNMGQVSYLKGYKRTDQFQRRFTKQYHKTIMGTVITPKGLRVKLTKDKKKHSETVKYLVARAFLYTKPFERVVTRDGDEYNCSVRNLRSLSHHPNARLTLGQKKYAYQKNKEGVSTLDLAVRFQVALSTITQAIEQECFTKAKQVKEEDNE